MRARTGVVWVIAGAALVLAALGGAIWVARRGTAERVASAALTAAKRWHCPMHPAVVSDRPGECPICFMALVPIEEPLAEPGTTAAGQPPPVASDRVPIRVLDRGRELAGVATTPVERARLLRTVRASGRVVLDESRLHHIHTKVAGYVERLYANTTGGAVRGGEPLLEIYSPELLASQQEYLVALRARAGLATTAPSPGSVESTGDDLVLAVRRRLMLFDVTDEQIRKLETTGEVQRNIVVTAPMSGIVVQRMVTQGERVEPGTTLLDVADLTHVWVIASVYEYELPFVREGQPARVSLPYLPGTAFEGRVALVYPTLDPSTRTAQVRIELPNKDLALKPEMFADVELTADLGEGIVAPDSAVLQTGERSLVFVETAPGEYAPREIRLGLRLGDRVQVVSGLAEGERVVTSGNFLVDSESRLRAAIAATAGSTPPAASPAPAEHRH